jgi:hypothetical protein
MSETTGFPRRDPQGRVVRAVDLLAMALAGTVLGVAALVLIEGLLALAGLTRFGRANGWLAVILPGWMLLEDVRAWRGVRWRIPLALGIAAVSALAGVLAAGAASFLPPLVSGAVGAAIAAVLFASLWFYGVRRLR